MIVDRGQQLGVALRLSYGFIEREELVFVFGQVVFVKREWAGLEGDEPLDAFLRSVTRRLYVVLQNDPAEREVRRLA